MIAQSAGTVECTNCFSAEGYDTPNECPTYDTKQSDSEVPVILELWGMWNYSSLSSLPGLLWSGVATPDKFLFMGQRELNCVFMLH